MKYLLDELLPRILPPDVTFQTIPHHGKRDLERSIPRKLRGWKEPGDIRFVILHDQDTKDCVSLKQELLQLCAVTDRPCLVRIACQEMEAWYFGDIDALCAACAGWPASDRQMWSSHMRKAPKPYALGPFSLSKK